MAALTRKKINFEWTNKCEQSFQELKTRLTTALVLTIPKGTKGYAIYSDASEQGLEVVLMQHGKDVDLFTLWAEETLIEDYLVLTFFSLRITSHFVFAMPAFFIAVFSAKEFMDVQPGNVGDGKLPAIEVSSGPVESKSSSLVDAVLCYVVNSDSHINNKPFVLLNVLNFLKALWQRAAQYINILVRLKISEKFKKQLSKCISLTSLDSLPDSLTEMEALNLAYKYQCQSSIMEIMAYDTHTHYPIQDLIEFTNENDTLCKVSQLECVLISFLSFW
ncbi:uncharacterized protein LOC133824318 [Humulus lupulus]|uniref:uncharacterized protein LOC133824318 n=1 Tax=Humulus lupulus TaxID=3486 RepID=UPI002B40DA37|nr:uncharacterized protein LOC133824318 [Humulus lupulus]